MASSTEAIPATREQLEQTQARKPTSFWPRPLSAYERENLLSSAILEERGSLDFYDDRYSPQPTPERPRFPLEPTDLGLKGELFSESIVRERGPY